MYIVKVLEVFLQRTCNKKNVRNQVIFHLQNFVCDLKPLCKNYKQNSKENIPYVFLLNFVYDFYTEASNHKQTFGGERLLDFSHFFLFKVIWRNIFYYVQMKFEILLVTQLLRFCLDYEWRSTHVALRKWF